jgi:hypothetical protein
MAPFAERMPRVTTLRGRTMICVQVIACSWFSSAREKPVTLDPLKSSRSRARYGISSGDSWKTGRILLGKGCGMQHTRAPSGTNIRRPIPFTSEGMRKPSAQRTRFQLRRPSDSEGGVCCKPELCGSAGHLTGILTVLLSSENVS